MLLAYPCGCKVVLAGGQAVWECFDFGPRLGLAWIVESKINGGMCAGGAFPVVERRCVVAGGVALGDGGGGLDESDKDEVGDDRGVTAMVVGGGTGRAREQEVGGRACRARTDGAGHDQ